MTNTGAMQLHDSIDGSESCSPTLLRGGLSRREWRRKLWHMLPGCLPFVVPLIPHSRPVGTLFNAIATVIAVSWTIWARLRFQRIRRRGESEAAANSVVFGYAVFVLLSLWLFPSHPELAMATLAILAWGDAVATIVGTGLGIRPLPWNSRKTVVGTLGFIAAALPTAVAAYHCESVPPVTWWYSFLVVAPAVLVAAAVESIDWERDDNLPTAFAAWVTVTLMHAGVVGL